MCYESTVEYGAFAAEDRKTHKPPSGVVASVPESPGVANVTVDRRRLSAKEFWDIIDPEPAGA